jgi:hypothetical protein
LEINSAPESRPWSSRLLEPVLTARLPPLGRLLTVFSWRAPSKVALSSGCKPPIGQSVSGFEWEPERQVMADLGLMPLEQRPFAPNPLTFACAARGFVVFEALDRRTERQYRRQRLVEGNGRYRRVELQTRRSTEDQRGRLRRTCAAGASVNRRPISGSCLRIGAYRPPAIALLVDTQLAHDPARRHVAVEAQRAAAVLHPERQEFAAQEHALDR